jgi:type IV pilus assembly protein PilW
MTRRAPRDAGMTLIELMIALVVVAILVAGIFRVYATSSSSLRVQTKVAEAQQTVRAARERIVYDLRMAGYFAADVQVAYDPTSGGFGGGGGAGAGGFSIAPVAVINSSTGPDELRVVYADTSCTATVQPKGPPFNAAVTTVNTLSCFKDGDIVIAVRTKSGGSTKKGDACVMKITQLVPGGPKIQHNPGQGAPINQVQNTQCDNLNNADWNDGYTKFMKYQARAYRIKPDDARGVLQVSETGGLSNDWQDLAYGVVDLQFAVRQYQPGDATDEDGDGNAELDWLSSENMEADLFADNPPPTDNQPIQVRVTIVARTLTGVDGPTQTTSTAIIGTPVANNNVGDRASFTLPNPDGTQPAWPLSMFHGNYLYRSTTTIVDLRNLGVGI